MSVKWGNPYSRDDVSVLETFLRIFVTVGVLYFVAHIIVWVAKGCPVAG